MDTSRYRAFVQASDQGSLSKAARTLNYTPSGVSQLITALERDLGFSVLERNPHGVQPTSEGSRILPAARAVVQEDERLLQVSSEIKGLAIGQVTIGSYPSVAAHWLPGVIKVFHERYPNIEVRIMEGIHQEITEWLDSKEADVGFMSYEPSLTYDWIPSHEIQWSQRYPWTTHSHRKKTTQSKNAPTRHLSCQAKAKILTPHEYFHATVSIQISLTKQSKP